MKPFKGRGWAFLAVVLTVAAVLRLYRLGTQSIWLDEAISWRFASFYGLDKAFMEAVLSDRNPPLFYIILRPFAHDGEWMLRLPSALFGVGAVWLLFLILERMVDKRAALIGALLLAVSPFHVWYSQEARSYALLSFLSLLALHNILEITREDKGLPLVSLAVVNALLLYTHYYGLSTFLAQFGVALTMPAKQRKHSLLALVVAWLIFIPWVLGLLEIVKQQSFGKHFWAWAVMVKILLEAYVTSPLFPTTTPIQATMALLSGLTALVLAFVGLFERRVDFRVRFSLALFAFGPVLTAFVHSFFGQPMSRYLIGGTGPFLGLVAIGLGGIGRKTVKITARAFVGLWICCLLTGLYRNFFDPSCFRDDWRSVARLLKADIREGDGILLLPPYNRWPFLFYAPEMEAQIVNAGRPIRFERILKAYEGKLSSLRRLWLIESHERLSDPEGLAESFFGRQWGRLLLAVEYKGIKVRLYVKRSVMTDSDAPPRAVRLVGGKCGP